MVIDAAWAIDAETFRSRYFATNQPVLLKGFVRSWPAFRKWSPRYFADSFGHVDVEVMCDLDADRMYDVEPYGNRRTMSIGGLAEMMERGGACGDLYLVAQNHALRRPELAELRRDLLLDPDWFDMRNILDDISLWMGPRATITPLHYDLKNVILAQAFGRKRVMLTSPLSTPWLYNEKGGYSQVNPERPDFDAYPLFRNVPVSAVVLEAGDALFLPLGWWHHVRSLAASISLSISNFAWPDK
jgi:hypothetical protein